MKLCLEKGLLVNAVRPNTLRLFPPLNVTEGDINKAIEILEEAFVELKYKGVFMAKDIAVLAYSGGLDSTISIDWIKENYGYDVITLTVDLGGRPIFK